LHCCRVPFDAAAAAAAAAGRTRRPLQTRPLCTRPRKPPRARCRHPRAVTGQAAWAIRLCAQAMFSRWGVWRRSGRADMPTSRVPRARRAWWCRSLPVIGSHDVTVLQGLTVELSDRMKRRLGRFNHISCSKDKPVVVRGADLRVRRFHSVQGSGGGGGPSALGRGAQWSLSGCCLRRVAVSTSLDRAAATAPHASEAVLQPSCGACRRHGDR